MNKNKATGITYDELMNSRFLEFPSHSEFMYKLCRLPVLCALLILGSVTTGILIEVPTIIVVMTTLFSLLVIAKSQISFFYMSGHGVGLIPKSKFSILGLPKMLTISYIIFIVLTFLMVVLSYFGEWNFPGTQTNFEYLSTFLLIAVILSLLSWRFNIYYLTWYGDEYQARVYFKNKGFSQQKIEEYIDRLKEKGVLSSRK
jgi:uncharacterized membrane protein